MYLDSQNSDRDTYFTFGVFIGDWSHVNDGQLWCHMCHVNDGRLWCHVFHVASSTTPTFEWGASNYLTINCVHDSRYAISIQFIDDFIVKCWVGCVVVDGLMGSMAQHRRRVLMESTIRYRCRVLMGSMVQHERWASVE